MQLLEGGGGAGFHTSVLVGISVTMVSALSIIDTIYSSVTDRR